jgi:SAP domain-containing ribonucleoprotein
MVDYAKKKNDELATLCKERGLSHTGKKADLVKRLQDHDAQGASTPAAPKPAIEDEIDWDDEPATETAKAATSEPAANAVAAGGVGEVANPQAVPNQVPAVDPSKTDDLTVAAAPESNGATETPAVATEEEKKEEVDYSSGLVDRTLDEEIAKRKARAKKFGLPEDSDEIKALERAKRFGTGDVPGLLNKALSSERKRGRDGEGEGGIRKRSRGRPGMGRRQGSERKEKRSGGKEAAPKANDGGSGWMTDKDRAAVEKRKARFATT